MHRRRIARGSCLALVIAAQVPIGCSMVTHAGGPTLGATGYLYQGGQASRGFPYTAEAIRGATIEAMTDLGIQAVQQSADGPGAVRLDGQTVDGRRATIRIGVGALPVVAVRVGWFGDEPLSRAILDRIGIRLGTLPVEAIPAEPPSDPGGPTLNSFFSRGEVRPGTPLPIDGDVGYRDSPIP